MANKKKAYPKIHLGESFVDLRTLAMFGTSDYTKLSKKLKKKLESYLTSDAGRKDAAAFRQSDWRRVNESLDAWKAVSAHNHAIDMAAWKDHLNKRYPLTALITPPATPLVADPPAADPPAADPPVVDPPVADPPVQPAEVVQEGTTPKKTPVTPDPLAAAKQLGFNSIDELKAFLAKVGLVADGNITDDLKSRHAWYNHMKGLGFNEGLDLNGQSWFSYGTNTYYNNGKVKLGNGSFSDYDYKTLSKNMDYATSDWRPHDYFRFHYGGTRQVTLPDGTFPVYVVRSGTVGNNNKWNLVEDESYAYDPISGKVRRLLENMFGMVQDQGDLKIPKWVEGEDWIDISTLPVRRSGGLLSTRKLYFNKQGGTMNRIKYFQQGGAAQQGAQDVQQQVIALVQAAMQGDEKANQTVTQIMEAAKAGDQQAMQLAQLIQEVAKQMQGQATTAKWGAKLGYIRSLKYAQGGKACPACEKGAPIKVEEKACGGKAKKAKKRYFGGWL